MSLIADYRHMLLIRRTEETILSLFASGAVPGTTHTCMGQEANAVAQTTPGQLGVSGDMVARGAAFGLTTKHLCTTDVSEIGAWSDEIVRDMRRTRQPVWAVIDTVRLGPHSKGDDDRDAAEMEA